MSNILVIKHGSLGDIAQASGAIQDIFENHPQDQIHILTTKPYFELFRKNIFVHNVILDRRLSRFNLIYLYILMRTIKKNNFQKIYDLQNSSRTKFYKNILFPKANYETWSSSETTLLSNTSKEEFDKKPVLDRFDHQLKTSGIKTEHTMKPNFSWAVTNIDNIKEGFKLDKYIVLFPFCSAHLTHKKWPHYNELIDLIKNKYGEQIKVIVAPGPSEIDDAKNINAVSILDKGKALDISQLASLIKESLFVVSNDTGPAHISAHLGVKGLTLFGRHITAYKVSIERENFKAIQVDDLDKLSAGKVLEKILI
ncbi:glycosyltransferase family 9 protein [Candidatus Pelagibacter sp.]|jgi:ADP-heptose:LPS heptosyltransferase|nr:glycosyltransferase family 9 protein [Candidatus Pelagibacter sp.]